MKFAIKLNHTLKLTHLEAQYNMEWKMPMIKALADQFTQAILLKFSIMLKHSKDLSAIKAQVEL